ncbi:hypothetical protein EVAR_93183_1 [Eumeta japonica]|uniref:Uncharacterized protein n=1 Tax=Eumeta variegata TaxID=151549 RepID=A0A4C1TXI9_EUMVA|nr:hypothetical protein EVAR_93183_1 [Eumeta japonica]
MSSIIKGQASIIIESRTGVKIENGDRDRNKRPDKASLRVSANKCITERKTRGVVEDGNRLRPLSLQLRRQGSHRITQVARQLGPPLEYIVLFIRTAVTPASRFRVEARHGITILLQVSARDSARMDIERIPTSSLLVGHTINLKLDFDPGPALDSAPCPASNSDSATSHDSDFHEAGRNECSSHREVSKFTAYARIYTQKSEIGRLVRHMTA